MKNEVIQRVKSSYYQTEKESFQIEKSTKILEMLRTESKKKKKRENVTEKMKEISEQLKNDKWENKISCLHK